MSFQGAELKTGITISAHVAYPSLLIDELLAGETICARTQQSCDAAARPIVILKSAHLVMFGFGSTNCLERYN